MDETASKVPVTEEKALSARPSRKRGARSKACAVKSTDFSRILTGISGVPCGAPLSMSTRSGGVS